VLADVLPVPSVERLGGWFRMLGSVFVDSDGDV